jgi:hypothetical protein
MQESPYEIVAQGRKWFTDESQEDGNDYIPANTENPALHNERALETH